MPPYQSDSQRRFFHSKGAEDAGIDKETVAEFDQESKGMHLPDKKHKGKKKHTKMPMKWGMKDK